MPEPLFTVDERREPEVAAVLEPDLVAEPELTVLRVPVDLDEFTLDERVPVDASRDPTADLVDNELPEA